MLPSALGLLLVMRSDLYERCVVWYESWTSTLFRVCRVSHASVPYVELRFGLDAVYFGLITPVVICTLECVGVCRCEVLSRLIGAIFGSWLDSMMKPYGLYGFTGTYLL